MPHGNRKQRHRACNHVLAVPSAGEIGESMRLESLVAQCRQREARFAICCSSFARFVALCERVRRGNMCFSFMYVYIHAHTHTHARTETPVHTQTHIHAHPHIRALYSDMFTSANLKRGLSLFLAVRFYQICPNWPPYGPSDEP